MPRYTNPAAIAALVLAFLPTGALGQAESGSAEKISQSANAAGSAGERILETSGPVYMGDEIRTDRRGEAQIRLRDNTRFVVGPNARVLVDSFVLSGRTARSVTFSAVRGAFRFITGDSPKSAYLIRTPVMTIGVRGTGLDGFVEPGTGRTTVALYEGSAELCDAAAQCIVIQAGCTIVVAPPGGGFTDPTPATRGLFLPYSISQASLLPQYRLDTSGCRGGAPAFTNPSESDTTPGGGGGGGLSDGGPPNRDDD
jgi:ferric-dicitrate binding protein FerR (iron transport regulator)